MTTRDRGILWPEESWMGSCSLTEAGRGEHFGRVANTRQHWSRRCYVNRRYRNGEDLEMHGPQVGTDRLGDVERLQGPEAGTSLSTRGITSMESGLTTCRWGCRSTCSPVHLPRFDNVSDGPLHQEQVSDSRTRRQARPNGMRLCRWADEGLTAVNRDALARTARQAIQ